MSQPRYTTTVADIARDPVARAACYRRHFGFLTDVDSRVPLNNGIQGDPGFQPGISKTFDHATQPSNLIDAGGCPFDPVRAPLIVPAPAIYPAHCDHTVKEAVGFIGYGLYGLSKNVFRFFGVHARRFIGSALRRNR